MKRITPLLLLSLLWISCQKKSSESVNPDAEQEVNLSDTEILDNELTDQQKTEGWTLLFDGKTTSGWRTFKNKENNSWEVLDGTLHCKPFEVNKSDKRADLITQDQYENFELSFDWKVQKQSNSGVMFRVIESYEEPYASGPEYQLLDDVSYAEVSETNFTGCVYGMYPVSRKKLNPVGDWNRSKIVSRENHIEHWLNDEKILEYDINSSDWNTRKASGKWNDFPGYGKTKKGHIDLQDQGNEVWFKNMMIKHL